MLVDSASLFLSYRREDTRYVARLLSDRLKERFGRVFMDIDTIQPGVDFTEVISQAVSECDVLLALIGLNWTGAVDEQGRRRLDDPNDWIVEEIRVALERDDVLVIPVLVDGASMPRHGDLPTAVGALATRQAVTVRFESFASDAARLVAGIEQALGKTRPTVENTRLPAPASGYAPPRSDSQGRPRIQLLRFRRPPPAPISPPTMTGPQPSVSPGQPNQPPPTPDPSGWPASPVTEALAQPRGRRRSLFVLLVVVAVVAVVGTSVTLLSIRGSDRTSGSIADSTTLAPTDATPSSLAAGRVQSAMTSRSTRQTETPPSSSGSAVAVPSWQEVFAGLEVGDCARILWPRTSSPLVPVEATKVACDDPAATYEIVSIKPDLREDACDTIKYDYPFRLNGSTSSRCAARVITPGQCQPLNGNTTKEAIAVPCEGEWFDADYPQRLEITEVHTDPYAPCAHNDDLRYTSKTIDRGEIAYCGSVIS